MKLKKLASLAMTGVLCVSMLAACGGSSSSAAVSGSAASGSASAAVSYTHLTLPTNSRV